MTIFSHENQEWKDTHVGCNNGAYHYSKELLENIVPKIKTKRDWVLINVDNQCTDGAIVFIHNNKQPERYIYLADYHDLILVCSQIKTLKWMIELFPQFHVIYLPLSIDTKYVKQFKPKRKTKKIAYFGREDKCPESIKKDDTIAKICGKDREKLLKEVGKYKEVYAIGRCALEAKCLGCKVLPHKGEWEGIDTNFEVLDNKDVIPELQRLLNEIDMIK